MKFYSQQNEDIILWKKYLNYKNGYFIELGAMDGVTYSNTKFFEDHLNWSGILIEPQPNLFSKLKINRPNCTLFDVAICDSERMVTFNTRNGGDSGGGISEIHIDKTIREEDNITVKGNTFKNVLSTIKKPELVDLFVIDVEGGELLVLQTFDWTIPVYIICIECHPNNLDYEKCKDILEKNGFVYDFDIGCNQVWINHSNKRNFIIEK